MPTKRQLKRQRKSGKKRADTDAAEHAAAAALTAESTAGESAAAAGTGGRGTGKGKGTNSGPSENNRPVGQHRGNDRAPALGGPAPAAAEPAPTGAWGKAAPPPPASAWGKPAAPATAGPVPAGRGEDQPPTLPAAPPSVWGRKTRPGGGGSDVAVAPAVAGDAAGTPRGKKGGRQNPAGTKGPLKPRLERAAGPGKKGGKTTGQPPPQRQPNATRARGNGTAASAGAAAASAEGYPSLAYKARSGPAARAAPLPPGLLKVPPGAVLHVPPSAPFSSAKVMSYGGAVRKPATPKPQPQPAAASAKTARTPPRAKGKNVRDEQEEAFPSLGCAAFSPAAVYLDCPTRPPRHVIYQAYGSSARALQPK